MSEILKKTLNQLDEWRHLPKYRLEPHVDVYFGMTLPKVLAKLYCFDEKELYVIPEFPIFKRLIEDTDKSHYTNVDFCVWHKENKKVFLVELKTDQGSIKGEQLQGMQKIVKKSEECEKGFKAFVSEIVQHWLSKPESKTRREFTHLLWEVTRSSCSLRS